LMEKSCWKSYWIVLRGMKWSPNGKSPDEKLRSQLKALCGDYVLY
jgi:hypothetical protein